MTISIAQRAEELSTLLRDRMGVHLGDGFAAKFTKAGRRLPRWARRKGEVILEAMALETHPKLAQQINHAKVNRAFKELRYFLRRQDPKARAKNRILDWITTVAFILFVTGGLILGVMMWQGLI